MPDPTADLLRRMGITPQEATPIPSHRPNQPEQGSIRPVPWNERLHNNFRSMLDSVKQQPLVRVMGGELGLSPIDMLEGYMYGGEAQNMGFDPASKAVSLFSNKAARELGTKQFLDTAMNLPSRLQDAAHQFAEKYPRIAGHILPRHSDVHHPTALADITPHGPGALSPIPSRFIADDPERMPMRIHGRGVEISQIPRNYETGIQNARRLFMHEGTHAAQGLGNRDFNQLYTLANNLVGYQKNPFEFSARLSEASGKGVGYNAIKDLEAMANQKKGDPYADQILEILERRRTTKAPDLVRMPW